MAEGKKDIRYIIFSIVNDSEVVVEKYATNDDMKCHDVEDYADNSKSSYNEFIDALKEVTKDFKDCRYAVFDFKFTGSREGAGASKMSKIIFLQVCPDGASIKRKMIYASSAAAIKSALGPAKIIPLQICDESQLSHTELLHKLLIDPQCKKDYDDMHSRKMYSYLIFRISDDDTTVIVEKKGPKGSSYKDFVDVRVCGDNFFLFNKCI
uniref:ADF-H domain-containing protein n=1 Tax=Soboliphyme baturini TaxID=241478 RepID=A0A183IWD0_9BILA